MRNFSAMPQSYSGQVELVRELEKFSRESTAESIWEVTRELARTNLHFLLVQLMGRKDADREWIYDRCREVRENPNGYLDLWSRFHYKSTINTIALTIQDILRSHGTGAMESEEWTFGIFSHTAKIAVGFARTIRRELEDNQTLRLLFPDILWENPGKEAPLWQEQQFTVRRKANRPEATIEAWGLVDGQPIGRHFKVRLYDDVVDKDSVLTRDAIAKTTESWELSLNLRTEDGIARYSGTRYHRADTYAAMIKRGAVKPRIYPGTHDGTLTGDPVLLQKEAWDELVRSMGTKVAACQLLQDPKMAGKMGFDLDDLRFYDDSPDLKALNIYLLCDPANEKNKKSDWTAFVVVGLGPDRNFYVLEVVRDRMSLSERTRELIRLRQDYMPIAVGYEKFGKDADINHIEEEQVRLNRRFDITPLGGKMPKNKRIEQLGPYFEAHRIFFPRTQYRTIHDGTRVNMIEALIEEEYADWPVSDHDDGLDCLARILDPEMRHQFPAEGELKTVRQKDNSLWRKLHQPDNHPWVL